ncbi:MAG TPA: hypothetical protein VK175_15180 [Leadbetterella sp.]|nr:hypothetical protein [Leadbetterella sp.]
MTIGSYVFNDLKDHTADMAFLHCADLYLLGQNVIKKLNWKFDFDKMELYVSKNPFELAQNEIVWPITSYKGNRPHINYSLGSKTYKNLLVDTGFTGIFELDSTNSEFLEIYSQKQKSGKSHEIITSSMGLMGLGKPSLNRHFRIDSLFIDQTLFSDLPVVINPSAEPKIGIYFFHNYCKTTTFNFSNNTILLDLRPQKLDEKPLLDGRVSIQNGKFIITAKAIGNNSSIKELNINDEILTVNNKRVSDFKDECEFLLCMYLFKEPELTLEKLNGQKIILKRWTWN